MPAQFAPRGTAALEAAQEQGRQILQQSNIQNANLRQAKEIAARREMAMREEAMRRDMANQAIIARQQEMAQAAEIQAQRDARIDGYEKQRTDELFEKKRAEQDYEATGGYSALEVARIANQRGVPLDVARRGLIEEKQRVDQEREIQANFENYKKQELAGIEVREQKQFERIDKGLTSLHEMRKTASQAMLPQIDDQIAQLEADKRGLPKLELPKTFAEIFDANTKFLPDGSFVFKDPTAKGKVTHGRVPAGGGAGPASAKERSAVESSYWPKDGEASDDEINAELDRLFTGPTDTKIIDGKHVRKTFADATLADRELAKARVILQKNEMGAAVSTALELMKKEHLDWEQALDKAFQLKDEAKTAAQARDFVEKAKRARLYNEQRLVEGKPIPSQYSPPPPSSQPAPGGSGDSSMIDEARRALQNPNLPPGLRAQIEEQLRSQ